ncbi:MAG: ATP-binding protein [Labilithrix sp.]
MLISARAVRILLEALERCRIEPAPILEAVGLDRRALASDRHSIPWTTFVRLNAEVAAAVDGDHGRLHLIGRATVETPSLGALRRIGRTVVSAPALYDIAYRWFARSNFPHIRLLQRIDGDRVTIHGFIPMSYEGSEPFLRVSAGSMEALPRILGLPASVPIDVRIDDRSLDLELRIPENTSLFRRARAAVGAVLNRRERAVLLERERQALDAGLVASSRSRDELRVVLERIPALVVIHVEGRILFANRALAQTLGFSSPDELVGRMLIDSVDPRSRDLFSRSSRQPAPPNPAHDMVEAWLLTRSGDPVLVETSPPQAIVFEGAPARLVVGRDIGERDRLHKQLATADRLAALGLLAAGVAHEVNNPLAYLLNNIEIAQKELAALGTGGEKARSALDIAIEGAHRIRFIVRELLLLAREEPALNASADLAETVRSTLALAHVEIEKTARVETELDSVPLIRGSVPRVAQIVLNLVLNSVEAMRSYDASRNELAVRVRRSGEERVLLEVTDNGVGVEGSDASRIFMPFFTTKAAGGGTGLGLAVTQRLVTELGGEISFTSERGVGTTFRVLFPIFDAERAAPPAPRSSAPRAG